MAARANEHIWSIEHLSRTPAYFTKTSFVAALDRVFLRACAVRAVE